MEAKEIVLPSGCFASFREITWGDVIASYSDSGPRMMAAMAMLVCQIDGVAITLKQINGMTIAEFMPIANIIAEMMPKDLTSKGVT